MFANVIVDISLEKLDRPFCYLIPRRLEDDISVGSLVEVPFGNGKRFLNGYVVEITDSVDFPVEKIKEIKGLIKNHDTNSEVTSRLIELAYWMKTKYGSTMNHALKTVFPLKSNVKKTEEKLVRLILDRNTAGTVIEQYKKKKYKAKLRLLEELIENPCLNKKLVTEKLNISSNTLRSMEAEGVIKIESTRIYRNPVMNSTAEEYNIILNERQKEISEDIKHSMRNVYRGIDDTKVHLIHGITGSGKTEIYIDLISECLDNEKDVIVLIPEIALTFQTVKRFTRKFGDKVSIINSKLSKGEKSDQFERASKGEVKIVVGPRSALFTPFTNVGLIIIDEEHESTYKSEQIPKYNAIEVAEHMAETMNAVLVLGSATPSLDSYYKAQNGRYRLHKLNVRQLGKLADVEVVDLREELKNGNKSIFSYRLQELINDRLERKEQIILFINRRGYAGFVSCRECGAVIKCPHCDVSLKAHNNGTLVCHYCGYKIPTPKLCPSCNSKYIAGFGTGTQKVETMVKQMFPQARVLRMDLDTTSKKGGHEEILQAFANHDADILVGTQMIVKGHDFPLVTLVGVLAADMSLFASDYRAAEKTFQLVTQAAGRAGRGEREGKVVIQTYNPDNYSIEYSKAQDYESFYSEEIMYRKLMMYPPVSNLLAILFMSEDKTAIENAAVALKQNIANIKDEKNYGSLMVIGPADASVSKINDVYRKVIYIKDSDNDILINVKDELEKAIVDSPLYSNVNIQFDFNPYGNY